MPREEKNSTGVCVLATNSRVTKSSSLVDMPERPLPPRALRPVERQRHALDVAGMADGDDHVLALDQVFVVHVGAAVGKLGAARRAELVAHGGKLVLDDLLDARARRQDVEDSP